jgi:hypothetical protein
MPYLQSPYERVKRQQTILLPRQANERMEYDVKTWKSDATELAQTWNHIIEFRRIAEIGVPAP